MTELKDNPETSNNGAASNKPERLTSKKCEICERLRIIGVFFAIVLLWALFVLRDKLPL